VNGCLGRAGLANFETILSSSIQNSYLIWQILQRYTHTVLRMAGYQLFFYLQKREVLLIRLNQQFIFPSHLSFALLLLSQVHVYCLFSHTHFFSFLYVSFHGLNLSCFGGYYSCLLKVMYVKFPSFVYLSRSYFLSQLFYLLPPLMGSSIRCETRVWKCRYRANIRYTVHAMRLSRGGGCYSNFTTGVNLLGTWVI